jgi:hypothetical protein
MSCTSPAKRSVRNPMPTSKAASARSFRQCSGRSPTRPRAPLVRKPPGPGGPCTGLAGRRCVNLARVRDLCGRLPEPRRIDWCGGPAWVGRSVRAARSAQPAQSELLCLPATCGVEAVCRALATAFHRRSALTVFSHTEHQRRVTMLTQWPIGTFAGASVLLQI